MTNTSHGPKWMCIGVPKSGTTSLYQVMKDHPELWIPPSKETQFFSSHNYDKGFDWYQEHFYADAPADRLAGELSPGYLRYQGVPQRIKSMLGNNLKFLVILRNPVDRAWSDYCHAYERFRLVPYRPTEDLSFEEALAAEPGRLDQPDIYSWTHGTWISYFNTGLYAKQLKNWFRYFDRSQFYVFTLEDLIEDTATTVDRITRHLGVSDFVDRVMLPKINSYTRPGLSEETRHRLVEAYRLHNEELGELLGRDFSNWNQ
jgi:hypothetical protein